MKIRITRLIDIVTDCMSKGTQQPFLFNDKGKPVDNAECKRVLHGALCNGHKFLKDGKFVAVG